MARSAVRCLVYCAGLAMLFVASAGAAAEEVTARQAARCTGLVNQALEQARVVAATVVQAGARVPRRNDDGEPVVVVEQAVCRVEIMHTPAPDSEIRSELWLPLHGWNRRFLGLGAGGEAGWVYLEQLAQQSAKGYAVAHTDMGTRPTGPAFSFGIDNPERVIDFGHRATQLMTQVGQRLTRAHYGRDARYNYFLGCSTGGQQALSQAQRYPGNYDGIVALSPVTDRTALHTTGAWNYRATHATPDSYIPQARLPHIHAAVLQQCDGLDGLRDGLIDDPRRCQFDFSVLACRQGSSQNAACLNPQQLAGLRKLYDGPRNPRTGARLHAGFAFGVAASPRAFQYALQGLPGAPVTDGMQPGLLHWATGWEPPFDFDHDLDTVDAAIGATVNAEQANLAGLRDARGKLLLIGGWADEVVPPLQMVEYYERVVATMGGMAATKKFARLFMAPGMAHCAGGVGPSLFDRLEPMLAWVEHDAPPERIIALKHEGNNATRRVERSRPLCAYPAVARWRGVGSIDDAATFACVTPGGPVH